MLLINKLLKKPSIVGPYKPKITQQIYYVNICLDDHTRVPLLAQNGAISDTEYINASYIKVTLLIII